jgi:hypothetical protein
MQPAGRGRVRCSAWLGRTVTSLFVCCDSPQNADEVVIRVNPPNPLSVGKHNLDYVKAHLWEHLPTAHVRNRQPVLWSPTATRNQLAALKLVNAALQFVVEPSLKALE